MTNRKKEISKEVVLKRYRPGADLSAGREPQYFSGIEQLEPRVLMSASVIGAEAMYPLADSALIQGDALTRGAIEFASPFVADTGATVIRRYTDRIDEQPAALDTGIGTASMAMTATGGVDIVITPGSTLAANQAAVDAFERAAAQWEAFLQDTITVNVLADLGSLPPTVLGSTNTVRAFKSASYGFNTVRNAMVADASGDVDDAIVAYLPTAAQLDWNVPSGFGLINGLAGAKANMKALGFDPAVLETDFGFYDGSITFNSSWAFDYDNSDGVTAGTIDFETVAAHELGHLLGFVSDVNYADSLLNQSQTGSLWMSPLDLYRFAEGGADDPQSMTDFTFAPRELRPNFEANTDDIDNEWRMSTGYFMGDGRQASHWRDNDLSGTLVGMMDPTLDTGQTFEITYADKRALDLIGYDVDLTGPTATIDNVTENATYGARVTGIASIGITFDEAVLGFDISDILLLRDSQQVNLSGATLVNSGDDIHFTLQNLVEETSYIGGQGVLWGLHDYELRLVADGSGVTDIWGNALADDASETWASRIRRGDLSGDGVLNVEDINPFVLALTNISGYQAAYPDIWGSHVGDYDGNDTINTEDMNPFVADLYSTGDNQNPGESLMGSGSGLSGSAIASYIMRMAAAVTAGQVDILSLVKSEQPFDISLIDGAEVAGEGELTAVDILAA